tara:strand:- start:339 stop:944 length:606 start_codon:yes stop_codon:yes gene_type:complete
MPIEFNKCLYLNAEKDNADLMLRKCIHGSDDLAWPCTSRVDFDNNILKYATTRADVTQDSTNEIESQQKDNKIENKIENKIYEDNHVEGFTNMGASYVRPGDLPDGYFRCPKSGKVKQVCMNCKYNQRTYGKSKEFNEGDYCFPNRGVYNGITNDGLTKCTCGSRGQYCGDNFTAQGSMFADNVFIMNVGDFGKLGSLAAY